MTNFNADPRLRDLGDRGADVTGLGPNFPGSLNDLWRMAFRPSEEFLRYVKLAIANDDGSLVGSNIEAAVAELREAALAQLIALTGAVNRTGGLVVEVRPSDTPIITTSQAKMYGPVSIPGVVPAVAYAALDQMGSALAIDIPNRGTILEATFHDLDDEGIDKEVWMFTAQPTLAADNGVFSIADADNRRNRAVFVFSTWRDGVNSQIGKTANTPATYDLGLNAQNEPVTQAWFAVKTLGTDTIAVNMEPQLSFVIQPAVS